MADSEFIWGVRCAWHGGSAKSRVTFRKLTSVASEAGLGSILPLPRSVPLASPLTLFGRSVGGLGRFWVLIVSPQGRPVTRLRPLLERFLVLLGDTRAPDGSWDALGSDFGSRVRPYPYPQQVSKVNSL